MIIDEGRKNSLHLVYFYGRKDSEKNRKKQIFIPLFPKLNLIPEKAIGNDKKNDEKIVNSRQKSAATIQMFVSLRQQEWLRGFLEERKPPAADGPTPEEFLGEVLGSRSFISEQAPLGQSGYMRIVLRCLSGPTTGNSKLTESLVQIQRM